MQSNIMRIGCSRGRLVSISILWVTLCLVVAVGNAQNNNAPHKKSGRSAVILYENDVHCAIDGYARVAGLRDAIRDTADVLMVSSGDYVQGSIAGAISKGQYVIDIMKAVGYDVITLGNHEFDYKIPRLLELTGQLKSTTVCANLFDLKTGTTVYAPFTIKKVGGWKVAFVGVVAPSTMNTERFAFFSDDGEPLYSLKPDQVYSLVQRAAAQARDQGADFVVVLSHLGEDKTDEDVDSHGLAAGTRGIDVILDAHTHRLHLADTVFNLDGKPVVISQTGSEFENVGKMLITSDGEISLSMIPVASISQSSKAVKKATEKVKKQMKKVTNRVVCRSEYMLKILDEAGEYLVRYSETNAGDIVTDAYRYMTGADVAFTNAGGLRNELSAGDLTYGDFIKFLPYDNCLTVVEAKGITIVKMLFLTTSKMGYDNGDFPQCSGIRYKIHTGVHAITDIEVLNSEGKYEPIDLDRTYRLVTIDYCVSGGGFARAFENCKVLTKTNIHYRDAVVEYVEEALKGVIDIRYSKPQGRITVVE